MIPVDMDLLPSIARREFPHQLSISFKISRVTNGRHIRPRQKEKLCGSLTLMSPRVDLWMRRRFSRSSGHADAPSSPIHGDGATTCAAGKSFVAPQETNEFLFL